VLARRRPLTDRNEYEIRNTKSEIPTWNKSTRESGVLYRFGVQIRSALRALHLCGWAAEVAAADGSCCIPLCSVGRRTSAQLPTANFIQFLSGCRRTLSSFGWIESKSAARQKARPKSQSQGSVKQFFIQKNFRKSRKKFSKTKKKNKFFSGKVKKQQTKKTQTNHSTFLGLSATKFLLAAATKHQPTTWITTNNSIIT